MTSGKNATARECLYAVIFLALGLACAPVLFYSESIVSSIWDDSMYTVTAFDKYWDDLVTYHDFERIWWKILLPYASFGLIRALLRLFKRFKKERAAAIEH
jgi:hypothetical protein